MKDADIVHALHGEAVEAWGEDALQSAVGAEERDLLSRVLLLSSAGAWLGISRVPYFTST